MKYNVNKRFNCDNKFPPLKKNIPKYIIIFVVANIDKLLKLQRNQKSVHYNRFFGDRCQNFVDMSAKNMFFVY